MKNKDEKANTKPKNKIIDKMNILYIVGIVFFIVFVIKTFYDYSSKTDMYMVNYGLIEKVSIVDAYIVKNEEVIKTDNSKTIVPIINEGEKVSKDSSIAFYEDESYNEKMQKVNEIDKKLLQLVTNSSPTSIVDTKSIEEQINFKLMKLQNENSFEKIRNANDEIEDLLLQRITLISSALPDNAEISSLLDERKSYMNSIKQSEQNINSTMSGIVTYRLDGLEGKYNLATENLTYNILKENVEKSENKSSYGIKVVDNNSIKIYFVIKNDPEISITENQSCKVRLLEKESKEIQGKITKIADNGDQRELEVEITSEAEDLIDLRKINCEIVWWYYDGLKVPDEAITKKGDISYVTVNNRETEYVVPVKIIKDNKRFSIIDNYDSSKLEELKLEKTKKIKVYDEININTK